VKRFMIEENYYWNRCLFLILFHDDIHIHGCIDERSLSHLKTSCFLWSLFGSIFCEGSSFTSRMKEHMDDYYFDASYILLEKHYRTWDPHLYHWSKFDIISDACVYGPHDDLLTWMYKHFHDPLKGYLLDVQLYDVVMYFNDLYFLLIICLEGCNTSNRIRVLLGFNYGGNKQ